MEDAWYANVTMHTLAYQAKALIEAPRCVGRGSSCFMQGARGGNTHAGILHKSA